MYTHSHTTHTHTHTATPLVLSMKAMKTEPSPLSSCHPQCVSSQLEKLLMFWATWTRKGNFDRFYAMFYRLSSLILFQGIARPAFIANTWAESIATFVMPAFCKRDFLSSSLRVSTSFSIRSDGSPPLTMLLAVCISEHLVLTVLEQAAEVGCRALVTCMNVIGYKVHVQVWFSMK